MRKTITLLASVILLIGINYNAAAQDPCASAIPLPNINDYCSAPKEYTNVGTTPSTFPTPTCWSPNATQDVWFKFTAIGSDLEIVLSTAGANGTIRNANLELISNCSATTITEEGCSTMGTRDTVRLYKGGMTVGKDYYIRVGSTVGNAGTFKLCVDSYTPPNNPGADCSGAVKLCDKRSVHVKGLSGTGQDKNELTGEGACLTAESNSCWYYWVCGKSGSLTFDLSPNTPRNDIDFVLYSITNGTNICRNRKVERCCASSCIVNNGNTGLNTTSTDNSEGANCDPGSDAYVQSFNMVVGTTYALLINNFTASSGFDINFGGTGEFEGPVAKVTSDKLTICEGETITFDGKNSTNYDKLQWNFASGGTPATVPATAGPHVIKYEKAGKYTAVLNAQNNLGCNSTDFVNITVNKKFNVTVMDKEICEGEEATLTANVRPLVTGGTFTWTPAATNDSVIKVTPTTDNEYTASYTVGGCSATGSGKVKINKKPTVSVTSQTICAGGDATLTADIMAPTGTYTYLWSTGDKTPSITVNPATKTTYTVTVTSDKGCKKDTTATVDIKGELTIDAGKDTTVCKGATVNFKVQPNGAIYTYKWTASTGTVSDPTIYNPTANPEVTTTYTVDVKNDKGCAGKGVITVTINSAMTPTLTTKNSSCNAVCDGTAEVTVTGGATPYVYSWNTTPGVQTTSKATGLCAGNYIATITDATGCKDTVQAKILEPKPITLDPVPSDTICLGTNKILKAVGHGGDGNYTYNWLPESTETTPEITVSPIVTTTYHVTIKDGNGCSSAPLTIKVTVNPVLKVTASNDVDICVNDSAKLSATGSGGNGGPYTYTWMPGMITGNKITVRPNSSTTYTVTIKDNCGTPAAIDSVSVKVNASPVVKFSGDSLQGCSPLTVNFSDSSTVTGGVITSWKWNFGDGASSDLKNPTHTYAISGVNTGVYTVTLTVKSGNCISSFTNEKMIRVFPMPVASFDAPVSTSIVNPTVHFTNTSVGAISWNWNFGDSLSSPANNISDQYSPNHAYAEVGEYCVSLLVKNNGGCADTAFQCIHIDPKFVLYIPNAFTPNGDGDNDFFYAKGEYINEFEMRIFDRWGNMVFYADAIHKPWNGKMNNTGEIVQQDIYVYQITIKDNKDKRHKYVGTVTLIKGG